MNSFHLLIPRVFYIAPSLRNLNQFYVLLTEKNGDGRQSTGTGASMKLLRRCAEVTCFVNLRRSIDCHVDFESAGMDLSLFIHYYTTVFFCSL